MFGNKIWLLVIWCYEIKSRALFYKTFLGSLIIRSMHNKKFKISVHIHHVRIFYQSWISRKNPFHAKYIYLSR